MKKMIKLTLAAILTICLCSTSIFAADGKWTSTAESGNWSDGGNWNGGIVAGGSGSTAYLTNAIPGTVDCVIDTDTTISSIVFADGDATPNNRDLESGAGRLTLAGSPTISSDASVAQANIKCVLAGTEGFTLTGDGFVNIGFNSNLISGTVTLNTTTTVKGNNKDAFMNADLVVGTSQLISRKDEFNAKTITVNNTGFLDIFNTDVAGVPVKVQADSITVNNGGTLGAGNDPLVPNVAESFDLLSPSITVNTGGRIKVNGGNAKSVGGNSITVADGGEVGFFNNFFTYTISNPLVLEGYGIAPSLGALTVQGLCNLTNNSPITLAGNTRIGMWGGGDNYMIMNGIISGTGPLNLLAQGGHYSHIRRFELHAANDYTGNTIIQGFAAQNITTLHGNNRLPNTILTLELSNWTLDFTNTFNLNGYDQDIQQLNINAGAGSDEIRIVGDGGTINAAGVGNYGALMNGNAVSLHGVTFDAGGSIIAMRNDVTLTVTGSTVRTTGPLGYLLMNHGPLNSYLNVGEDGLVDVQLLRMADMTDPANLSPVVNLNVGGTIQTSLIWIDGTNAPDAIFRFNGGTLENHESSAFDDNWIWADHSTVIADGGANISVDRDITIQAPLLHDPAAAAVDGGLTKLGLSNLTLSAVCEYTGPTVVSEGTLVIDGDITSSSSISVEPGAAIGGSGIINGFTLASGGAVAPGSSIGTLNINSDFTMNAGALYNWEVTSNQIADSVNITGSLIVPAAANSVTVNVTKIGTEISENEMVLFTTTGHSVDPNSIFLSYSGIGGPEHPTVSGNDIVVSGLAPVPDPPQSISASEGVYADKVAVSWYFVDNATKYQVWRSLTNNSGTAVINSGEVDTNLFDDTTTAQETFYYYWVKAGNTKGWSGFSDSARGFSTASTGPVQPTNSLPIDGTHISMAELPVTLEMQPYYDALGWPMVSIQWQMNNNNDFSNPSWNSGELSTTNITIELLSSILDSTNYWRARFKNSWNRWSEWSEPTFFTTTKDLSSPFYFYDTFNNVSGSGNVNKDYTASGRQYGRIIPIEYSFTGTTEVGGFSS